MSKRIITVLWLINILHSVKAQTSIQADRPDQTETPFSVPFGYFQAENGFSYENVSKGISSIAHPSVLWKYGASKNLEFRLITELVSERTPNETITGFTPVVVGFKVNITEEKGMLPTTSLLGHISLPKVASPAFKASYYAPSFRFTMQHTLSKTISLGYNLGAEWDGETPEPTFIYTLTTGFSLNEKIGSFIEVYGFVPKKHTADHRIDGGVTYLISDNVMIDLSGGLGITSNAPKSFASAGFSYRFNTKKPLKN